MLSLSTLEIGVLAETQRARNCASTPGHACAFVCLFGRLRAVADMDFASSKLLVLASALQYGFSFSLRVPGRGQHVDEKQTLQQHVG